MPITLQNRIHTFIQAEICHTDADDDTESQGLNFTLPHGHIPVRWHNK